MLTYVFCTLCGLPGRKSSSLHSSPPCPFLWAQSPSPLLPASHLFSLSPQLGAACNTGTEFRAVVNSESEELSPVAPSLFSPAALEAFCPHPPIVPKLISAPPTSPSAAGAPSPPHQPPGHLHRPRPLPGRSSGPSFAWPTPPFTIHLDAAQTPTPTTTICACPFLLGPSWHFGLEQEADFASWVTLGRSLRSLCDGFLNCPVGTISATPSEQAVGAG